MGDKFDLKKLMAEGKVPNLGTNGGREQIEYIHIDQIDDDPNNFYELSNLEELAANIELLGLQQPIRVRPNPEDPSRVIIVSGHRRRAAIRLLVDEGKKELAEIPCIREAGTGSAALQELRLIYANSDTRKMTSADISKQAERVEQLLYQLKEEGMEFPGRMRDHVAEACKVSKSKLARLKVIRENLTPYFSKLYNENTIGESVAYEIAKMPYDHQAYIEVHQDLLASSIRNWAQSTAVLYERRLAEIDKIVCKGGGECTNRKGKYDASLKRQTWDSDTFCAKCCSKCDKLISCKYACPGLAGKIKKLKADRKAQQEHERMVQREKDMPVIREIQRYWERFGKARAIADVSLGECWNVLHLNSRYHGDDDKVMAMECLEYTFLTSDSIPYGWVLGKDHAKRLVELADLLGCSLDYLLCRTDDPKWDKKSENATQGTGVMWYPRSVKPKPGTNIVVIDDLGCSDNGYYSGSGGYEGEVQWDEVVMWTLEPTEDVAKAPAAEPPAKGWVPLQWLSPQDPKETGRLVVAKFKAEGVDEPMMTMAKWDGTQWCFKGGASINVECVGWFPLPKEDA